MFSTKIVTALVLISFCGPVFAAETCITQDDRSLADGAVVQRETILLKREFQRVVRTDCSGKVISDKEETVTAPEQWVTIRPLTEAARADKKSITDVLNRTTCEGPGWGSALLQIITAIAAAPVVIADQELHGPSIRFLVNSSPTGAMRVLRGRENFLDYSFKKCVKREGEKCLQDELMEKGTLILDVQYSEARLNGPKEIPAEGCAKK